ncbi:hypothetical protein KC19_6G152500 [Ceratodon purpureus]|uniref:Uncharacterized protein n=1 Tax=Ceratodon purpureus TaxID=3225 RepID=A0A8T0HEV8_CERPU|nr:hypothetical protein KC19_6G152500 [Ceratodon purpureus]
MEEVNLHELPRKELKQLCNEHSIRTAGVKHDDLVHLLRNKLYPPAPDPPRLQKAGSQMSSDSQISSKATSEVAAKTLLRSTSQGRSQRSLVFVDDPSQEKAPERSRRELSPSPVLPRKPILTKSNSSSARRSDFLRKKVSNTLSGLSKQSQESLPQQSDGSSDKSRSNNGAKRPSSRNTSTAIKRPSAVQVVKTNGVPKSQTNIDAYSEAASSPRASEGDASAIAMDSSDLGSHSFGSVSEIATDAGHHAISEGSDNDDRRSVSSEPALRFPSQINRLTPRKSAASKLGRGVYSSRDTGHGRDSLDSSARSNEVLGQDSDPSATHDGGELFQYFLEDTESLVGETDGLDSFLDAGIADPEDINRTDGHQVDLEQFHTPETYTARYQEDDILDLEGRMKDEVALTAVHNVSELGDCLVADQENAPTSERAGVHSNAAALPSESEARIKIFNNEISKDSLSIENFEPPQIEDVEPPGPTPVHVTIEEPQKRSDIEASHLCDTPSSSGQDKSAEASDASPDSVHIEDQDYESRSLGVECNRAPEDVARAHIPRNDEDVTESLMTSREDFEHTQAASPPSPPSLVGKIDSNNVSGKHGHSQVVITTARADFENTNQQDSEGGTSVDDASDNVSEDIHDTESISADPDESSSDMKWSTVSALYEDLEDVNNAVDIGGYGLPGHKQAETDEADNNLPEDVEPLTHLYAPVSEAVNHAEEPAIDAERHEGVVKKNFGTASPSFVNIIQGWKGRNPSPDEIASKSDKQKEAEHVLQNETSEIALKSDSFPKVMYTTGGEAACEGHEDEGTRSRFSFPMDLDSSKLSNVLNDSDVVPRVSQQNSEPFSSSGDEDAEEASKSQNLLRSRVDNISGASSSGSAESESSRSFTLTRPTFEGLREENISAVVNLQPITLTKETETSSTCEEEEDIRVFIRPHALVEETQSSTGLKTHGSRLPVSQDLQETNSVDLDKLEKSSHDNSPAISHPRKIEKILTVGLKMIFVIGSITLGILKFRASRLRLAGKS